MTLHAKFGMNWLSGVRKVDENVNISNGSLVRLTTILDGADWENEQKF